MSKLTRIFILISIVVIVFIAVMTWFYPYSVFSVYKNYSYTSDPVVTEDYVQDLNDFKSSYQTDSKEDITSNRTQYIVPAFEQDWLVNSDSVDMNADRLDTILFEIEQVKDDLFDLITQEDYSREEREFLMLSIKNILITEEQLIDLKYEKNDNRNAINRKVRNMHMSYVNSFKSFVSFYEVSQIEPE